MTAFAAIRTGVASVAQFSRLFSFDDRWGKKRVSDRSEPLRTVIFNRWPRVRP